MVDDISSTEESTGYVAGVDQGSKDAHCVHTGDQEKTDSVGHGDIVEQGVTDGNIAVIRHCCQHVGVINTKEAEEKELGHALSKGGEILLWNKVHQQLGNYDSGVAEIYKGQVTEKIIHGCVKLRTDSD